MKSDSQFTVVPAHNPVALLPLLIALGFSEVKTEETSVTFKIGERTFELKHHRVLPPFDDAGHLSLICDTPQEKDEWLACVTRHEFSFRELKENKVPDETRGFIYNEDLDNGGSVAIKITVLKK